MIFNPQEDSCISRSDKDFLFCKRLRVSNLVAGCLIFYLDIHLIMFLGWLNTLATHVMLFGVDFHLSCVIDWYRSGARYDSHLRLGAGRNGYQENPSQ